MLTLLLPSRYLLLVLLSVGCLTIETVRAENSDGGMNWSFTPYVWFSDISLNVAINDQTVVDSEIKFSDLIDKIDVAFQGHLEGYGDRFGFFADLTYLSISDDVNQHGFSVDAEVATGLYELAAVYNLPGTGNEGFSLFGGLRHLSVDQKIKLQGEGLQHTIKEDADLTDFMLGARYRMLLSDRWELGLRADYSDGDTDGAWNLQALVGYRIRWGTALLGYRHFEIDLKEGPLKTELTMSGPQIGFRFDF